jgi:hypothetical protein
MPYNARECCRMQQGGFSCGVMQLQVSGRMDFSINDDGSIKCFEYNADSARCRRVGDTRRTSRVTCHSSHVARNTSHVTRHTSHVTRHTSHVTRHHQLSARVRPQPRRVDDSCRPGVLLLAASAASAASSAAAPALFCVMALACMRNRKLLFSLLDARRAAAA